MGEKHGREGRALAQRAGTWDATFTSWGTPGATPVTTGGLVAEREMIGPMLQERPYTVAGVAPAWTKIDNITFNRTETRWDDMSMGHARRGGHNVGLEHQPRAPERIFVSFQPFALPGNGPDATGQMMRMEEVSITEDADHEVKDQYFIPADGVVERTKWARSKNTGSGCAQQTSSSHLQLEA